MIDEISNIKERLGKIEGRLSKLELEPSLGHRKPIQLSDAVCSSCGKSCKVPFVPKDDRPLYCRECYQQRKRR